MQSTTHSQVLDKRRRRTVGAVLAGTMLLGLSVAPAAPSWAGDASAVRIRLEFPVTVIDSVDSQDDSFNATSAEKYLSAQCAAFPPKTAFVTVPETSRSRLVQVRSVGVTDMQSSTAAGQDTYTATCTLESTVPAGIARSRFVYEYANGFAARVSPSMKRVHRYPLLSASSRCTHAGDDSGAVRDSCAALWTQS